MTDVSFDFGSSLPYLEEKLRALIKHDSASLRFRELVNSHLKRAISDAAWVQILGMERPISIFDIYQPSRLRQTSRESDIAIEHLIAKTENALILAGPGRGKTILLRHTFATFANSRDHAPILFTLRWPLCAEDLSEFVGQLVAGKRPSAPGKLLLLIDGLDEVPPETRSIVLRALREFETLKIGSFLLTCRKYYIVGDLTAARYEIAPFTAHDSLQFITMFAKAYGSAFDPHRLLDELVAHRFDDFLDHPLMLALICILKSGSAKALPRTPVLLIREAIRTLTDRWDNWKGVARSSYLPVSGQGRVNCLKYVAFGVTTFVARAIDVERLAREFIRSSDWPSADVLLLLDEIAQWYGLLIPIGEDEATFAHKAIHDYLAAAYWVESAKFAPHEVVQWDARAAYAVTLLPEATESILASMNTRDNIETLIMCLQNKAIFDAPRVARAVVYQLFRSPSSRTFTFRSDPQRVAVHTALDFFGLASDAFLRDLLAVSATVRGIGNDLVSGYVLAEISKRGQEVTSGELDRLLSVYGANMTFVVDRPGIGQVNVAIDQVGRQRL